MDTDETPETLETSDKRPLSTWQTTPDTMVLGVCSISGNSVRTNRICVRSDSVTFISAQMRSAIPSCVFRTDDTSDSKRARPLQRARMDTWNSPDTSSWVRVALC